VVGVEGVQRLSPQDGAPNLSLHVSHDLVSNTLGPVSDGFCNSVRPKTPNRKYYGHVTFTAMAPIDRA